MHTGTVGGVIGSFYTFNGIPGPPFSADVIDETDKFLADGNHIHRESHGKIFRDSQGRMRTETEVGNFGPESKPFVHVAITDPVEGRFIHLDFEHKTATVSHFPQPSSNPGIGRSIQPAGNPPQVQPAPATATVVQRGALATRESSEDLGTMQIEGFTVSGTRYIHTMAAGTMGNDKPITISSERWFSPDLKMDLVNTSENPESGKHVRKLVNIHTGDPDPLLLQVPAEFSVTETPQQ
jgi:hypothetical protein